MKTLVWITHTFRKDSRLYNSLEGECTFVYYSPFYFAGDREKAILKNTNWQNLELFYGSINHFRKALTKDGEKMFNATHILSFKTKADTNVIADVATKIMGTGNVNIMDAKKN